MRLKVLIPPFLIVMTLILLIGFIKPDLDVLQAKRADILAKGVMVANIDMIIANAGALNSSLDTAQNFEKFAYRYLPSTQNQEQVVDAFNFLATQSGMVITKMELKQPLSQNVALIEGSAELSGMPVTPSLSEVKTFVFTGSVVGSYENIKAFFDRLTHMERFQKVNLFSIEIDPGIQPPDTNRLIGTFETEFGYLSPVQKVSALDVPIFLRSEFDFSNVSKLLEQSTSAVPTLEKGQTGRPNPFQ